MLTPLNIRLLVRSLPAASFLCLAGSLLDPVSVQAASQASDNAGNYDPNSNTTATGFVTGSNQGSGFQPFVLTATNQAGYYISQGSADSQINTNGSRGTAQAFALYGYGAASGSSIGFSSATRPFTGSLSIGQTFSISLDSRGVQNGQTVGLSLNDSSGNARFTLDFLGGTNQLRVTDASGTRNANTGANNVNFATFSGGINVAFTLTGADTYSVTATGVSDVTRFDSTSGILAGTSGSGVDRARIFDNDAGNDSDLFFNSLAITAVPEPGSVMGIGVGALCALAALRRARRTIWRHAAD